MGKQIKVGDRVAVFNRTIGAFVLEGYATVVAPDHYDRWRVRFDDGLTVSRFVDPAAQADPDAHLAMLNRNIGANVKAEAAS